MKEYHTITLRDPKTAIEDTIKASEDETIYREALEDEITLPTSCRTGRCSTCVARLEPGTSPDVMDQSRQQFLTPAQIAQGFVLTCIAYPRDDCTLEIKQEKALYLSPVGTK